MASGQTERPERVLTGRMVLVIFLAFFGIIIAANTIMMIMAARTYDGVQEEKAYSRGRTYNDRLSAARAQQALGWTVVFDHEAQGDPLTRLVSARFLDARNRPLDNLSVEAEFFSQIEQDHDRRQYLASLGDGRYQGVIHLPREGRWQFRIRAYKNGVEHYYLYKESFVEP